MIEVKQYLFVILHGVASCRPLASEHVVVVVQDVSDLGRTGPGRGGQYHSLDLLAVTLGTVAVGVVGVRVLVSRVYEGRRYQQQR